MATKKKKSQHIEDYAEQLDLYDKLLNEYVNYWIPILGLDSWVKIDVSCFPTTSSEDPGILGRTFVHWEYMEAKIEFFVGGMISSELGPERVEYLVVHELCHCLVNEIRDENTTNEHLTAYVIPHEERVVCNLAKSFLRLKYLNS